MFSRILMLRAVAVPAVLLLAACDNPVEDDDHADDVVGVDVATLAGANLASYRNGAWTFPSGDALRLEVGEETEVRIHFLAADGDRFVLPASGAELTHAVEVENPAIAAYAPHGDHGDFEGLTAGQTRAKIQIMHGSHADFETNPGLPITVVP